MVEGRCRVGDVVFVQCLLFFVEANCTAVYCEDEFEGIVGAGFDDSIEDPGGGGRCFRQRRWCPLRSQQVGFPDSTIPPGHCRR